MKFSKFIWVAIMLIASMLGHLNAQTPITDVVSDFDTTSPIVPMDVAQAGRKAVVSYVGTLVDHVTFQFDGRSMARAEKYTYGRSFLRDHGYVHDGSFGELFAATSDVNFDAVVARTPEGRFDVNVSVTYWSTDNRILLQGYGQVNIKIEEGGTMFASFDPYVWLPATINIQTSPSTTGARWIGETWANPSQDVSLGRDSVGQTFIRLNSSLLDEGMLLVETHGGLDLTGYGLRGQGIIRGKDLFATIGSTEIGEIKILENADGLNAELPSAYRWEGKLYGFVPLQELKVNSSLKRIIMPQMKIWNTGQTMIPSKIIVHVVYQDPNQKGGPLESDFELPWSDATGGWILNLPDGIFHLEYVFPQLSYQNWGAKG